MSRFTLHQSPCGRHQGAHGVSEFTLLVHEGTTPGFKEHRACSGAGR